jgi:hypothetical protein
MAEKITAQTSFVVLVKNDVLVLRPGITGLWARDDGGPRVDATLTAAKPGYTLQWVIYRMNA